MKKICRLGHQHIPQLAKICKCCFPNSIRWQGVSQWARKWWEVAVSCEAVEVWGITSDSVVHAFCVLVTDEILWDEQKRLRKGSWALQALTFLKCPFLSAKRIQQKLIHENRKKTNRGLSVGDRTWLEIIAVAPQYRGCGLARQLLECCEHRTKSLGRKGMVMKVDANNRSAIRFYEYCGFIQVSDTFESYYYAKML